MRLAVDEKKNRIKRIEIGIYRMALYLLLTFLLVRTASSVSDPDSHRECQQFTADKEIKNLIEEKQKLMTPCPCVKQKIELDYSFEKIGDCYRQRLFEEGVKQMCCYRSDGNIRKGAPQGGYMLFETLWKNMSDVHRICCREEITCDMFYEINPSDDCSGYQPPVTVISSGDPTIQTIDGATFDFNGHGEYVFLKTDNLEIQVRLGYVTPGNTDSTLFEAFSIFDNKTGVTFEVHTYENDINVYKNGMHICNANREGPPSPCEIPLLRPQQCMVQAGDGEAVIIGCGVQEFTRNVVFTAGVLMSLRYTPNQYAKTVNKAGLAGHQKNGSFVCRNGTEVNVNSSESMIFDYGESWYLRNETESHFNYSITGGNFSFYNGHHSSPRFLENLVGNLTELFKGYSAENISNFNETCRNYWNQKPNKQCLLTIAKSKNYNLGLAVMATVNATHHTWEILHNKAPSFLKGMPKHIKAVYTNNSNIIINLTQYIWDEDTDHLSYNISTDLFDDEYTLDNGVFTWNVGTSLRYIDTSFTFYVIDKLKASGSHDVTISYCGCDNPSECNFDTKNSNSSGNVIKAGCECPDYFTGLYCETELDPCEDYKCFDNKCSKTFDRSLESWPCAPCSKGRHTLMTLKEQKCQNIDECDPGYSGEDKCEQNCNDTDGSFVCSCETGYTLNSNKYLCDDVDECTKPSPCKEHEICINNEGSYVCDCAPGYTKKNSNNTCAKISESSTPYVGSIAIIISIKNSEVDEINKTIDTPNNRNTFKKRLDAVFQGTPGYESVEVFRIIIMKTSTNHTMKEVGQFYRLNVQYIVHWSKKSDDDKVAKALQQSFSNNRNKSDAITLETLSKSIDVRFVGADVHVNNANETGLCDIASKNDCHSESTDCHDENHKIECKCKRGYTSAVVTTKFCKEIDECMQFTKNSSIDERCVHGTCVNTPGSWNCSCPANKMWQNVGNKSYPVYRCQGDYQYIGEIKLLWIAHTFEEGQVRDFLNETIESLFSKKDDLKISFAKESPHMHEVFLSVEYLNATVDNSTSGFVHVTSSYILHLGESVTSGWVEKYQLNAFNKSNSFIFNDGTNVNIIGSSIFNESGKNLCNIPNKTKCDLEFTTCSVHNGSYSCACKSGFHVRIDDHYCKDIDECKDKHVVCGSGNCSNTVGSWECLCNETSSFRRINDSYGVCEDTNECIDKSYICQGGNCSNKHGGWECVCETGYYPETIVLDKIYTCTDKDECKNNATTCLNGESCVNLPGNWTCECPPGFENRYINQSSINCTDVNECTNGATCLNGGSCVNKPGTWKCNCPSGFEQHRINETFINCTDIDECKKSNYSCEGDNNSSRCHNLPGSWNCSCIEGYKSITVSETARKCEDIDECGTTLKDISCLDASECVNTVGSWKCICRDGFTEYVINKTSKTCGDIDECGTTLTDISCLEASECVNTVGSWKCICDAGFTDNVMNKTSKTCEDIDECGATLKDISCLDASECVNTIGSWKCLCSDGFTEHVINKTSKTCEDDYQYVASVSFSLSGEITDGSEIKEAITKKIMEMYIDAFNDPGVWIEILKITVLPEKARQKRSVPQHDIKTDYVVHTTAEKTKDELNTVETVYRNGHSCVNQIVKCPDEIDGGFKIQFDNIQTKSSSAICETNKNYCDQTTTTCVSTNGQLVCNCTTKYPQKKSRTNCIDPCQNSKCHETSSCSHWNNDDGYICGCRKGRTGSYCTKIDHEMQYKKQQTTSIAVGSSLGALVLILAGVIFGVCRWRAAKIKEAEKIDSSRFKNFDDFFLKNQYMRDSGDGGGSLYSHRLSNVSIPRVKINGDLFKNQNGHISNSLYAKPQKQQKPEFHGSMPNLAHGDAQFYPSDYRRLSDQYPNRFSGGYDHALSASCNDLRNVNGWTSPVSDYDRFGLPNPDYNPSYDVTRPGSPKPDYDRRGRHDAFKDSGVGNGYSSDSNDIRRTDQRRGYPNEYRYSDTKF